MKINKTVLDNGLTIIHEKRDVPVTTVMLGVRYGFAYENEEEKGIAHFIEHLCFKGTKKRSAKEIAETLEKVGGDINAFTHEEVTAYHVKLPSKQLELAMDVLFDIFFNPIFPEKEVKKEANVISEEIKMYHDNPQSHTLEKLKENLYKKPFGMFGAGTAEKVKGMKRSQLLEKHRKIYVPKNSILCVVGNNKFEDVLKFAEKFCVERTGEIIKDIVPVLYNIKTNEKRETLQQATLAFGFHFPSSGSKEIYAAELFNVILGQGMSSKLFTEVREKRGLVYAVRSNIDAGKNYGYLVIFAGTDKEKINDVIKICLDEVRNMKSITEKELEEAKTRVFGMHDVQSENSNDVAVSLILEEISGDARNYEKFKENIKKVTLEEIKKLSKIEDYSSFYLSN